MRTAEHMTVAEAEVFARKIVLDRLAERDRSRHELQEALDKRRVPPEVSEVLLDKLETSNLLDDERFARSWVESRQRARGLAKSALARELRAKGIDPEITQIVVDELDPEEERASAHRLVQRRMRSVARLEPEVQLRRLSAMLMRKGYPPSLALDVVRDELDAEVECADLHHED